MAKIDTQFMTKTAEKPYPLGPHIIAHITEYPPGVSLQMVGSSPFLPREREDAGNETRCRFPENNERARSKVSLTNNTPSIKC